MRKKKPGRPIRPHFDFPMFNEKEIEALVSSPDRVACHAFYPFLSFSIKTRRFQKDPTNKKRYKISVKERPIRMASHCDTYILHHYAGLLGCAYEKAVKGTVIDKVAVAYRKGKGSNIDIANETFACISKMGQCAVIAFDLSQFFETIDHQHLKACWEGLLGTTRLPEDHYKVFKAVTNYSVVSVDDVKCALGIKNGDPLPMPIFKSASDMRSILRPKGSKSLIERHSENFGVPQGSPISALLSNVSMMQFDVAMATEVSEMNGIYRRYSDDILVAVPLKHFHEAVELFEREVANIPGPVRENEDKRVVSVFDVRGKVVRGPISLDGKEVTSRILQYLGFLYDGEKVVVRSQTLARYWRKVTRGVRAAKRRAAKNPVNRKVFRRKLFQRFSHLGRQNLHAYKRKSIRGMEFPGIKNQFSRNWKKLQQEIAGPIKRPRKPSR